MKYFTPSIVKPLIRQRKYQKLLEIGANKGENSDKLLEIKGVHLTMIDPCFDCNLADKYRNHSNVRVLKGLSLEVLPQLHEPFDAIFIDGDHNWYTVYNELKAIEKNGLLAAQGTIFFHDVNWPYARRDMYYVPESIPADYRHPYAKKGIAKNVSALMDQGGCNPDLNNAIMEGGNRNGVLTAIEDFIRDAQDRFDFVRDPRQCGLGILFRQNHAVRASLFMRITLETFRAKVQRLGQIISSARLFPSVQNS